MDVYIPALDHCRDKVAADVGDLEQVARWQDFDAVDADVTAWPSPKSGSLEARKASEVCPRGVLNSGRAI
ncbi:hypothetical protein [Nocardia fluminea]|uniref:hypothetical protein n=1 Tax=Nocardia fluminea TaxID=134984 RepID=UPI00342524BD